MSVPSGSQGAIHYQVSSHGKTVYVRCHGLANMKNAPVLDAYLDNARTSGAHTACIDLAETTGMDSTFMGMLVGQGHSFEKAGGKLVVVRPSERSVRLLKMLGIFEVLPVVENCTMPDLHFVPLQDDPGLNLAQRMELVRRAHQSLSALSEANHAKFSDFLSALERDLGRQRAAAEGLPPAAPVAQPAPADPEAATGKPTY